MHHAHSPDDWRPGFAKRAPNFDALAAEASAWEPEEEFSPLQLHHALIRGTPELTMTERCVLASLATHLNADAVQLGDAHVWPSDELIAGEFGCSQGTVRAARRSLEAKGYLVRDYTPANRRAGPKATDLAPLVARTGEMKAHFESLRAARAQRQAALKEPIVHSTTYRRPGVEILSPKQSQSQGSIEPVREADAPSARNQFAERRPSVADTGKGQADPAQRTRNRTSSAICSPKGASGLGGALPGSSEHAEMVRQELAAAAQVCPEIAPLVTPALIKNPASAPPEDVELWAELAQRLLPDPERNNDETFRWAYKKHGPRALAMLAVCLVDSNIKMPGRYFGRLATTDQHSPLDLRFNFRRIMALRPPAPPPVKRGPGIDNPVWQGIEQVLRPVVHPDTWASWFDQLGFVSVKGGVLNLSADLPHSATHIQREFGSRILEAARECGLEVTKLMIVPRRRSTPPPP